MNHYSTVQEHGVQPELPAQHSSCESWLLISERLSGTNIPCPHLHQPAAPAAFHAPLFIWFLLYPLLIALQQKCGAHVDELEDGSCCHVFHNRFFRILNARFHQAGQQGRTVRRFGGWCKENLEFLNMTD